MCILDFCYDLNKRKGFSPYTKVVLVPNTLRRIRSPDYDWNYSLENETSSIDELSRVNNYFGLHYRSYNVVFVLFCVECIFIFYDNKGEN